MDSTAITKTDILNRLADHYGPQKWWSSDNKIADWLSMILIQQTTDVNADRALANLADVYSAEKLIAMPLDQLQELIRPAGFFKAKSAAIKGLMQWFINHGGDFAAFDDIKTDDLHQELLSLKGVGPETADDMLLYTFDRNTFVADQYAMRLFSRLGFGEYKSYNAMRDVFNPLAQVVPLDVAKEWHAVIDVHGKEFRRHKDLDESWLLK